MRHFFLEIRERTRLKATFPTLALWRGQPSCVFIHTPSDHGNSQKATVSFESSPKGESPWGCHQTKYNCGAKSSKRGIAWLVSNKIRNKTNDVSQNGPRDFNRKPPGTTAIMEEGGHFLRSRTRGERKITLCFSMYRKQSLNRRSPSHLDTRNKWVVLLLLPLHPKLFVSKKANQTTPNAVFFFVLAASLGSRDLGRSPGAGWSGLLPRPWGGAQGPVPWLGGWGEAVGKGGGVEGGRGLWGGWGVVQEHHFGW